MTSLHLCINQKYLAVSIKKLAIGKYNRVTTRRRRLRSSVIQACTISMSCPFDYLLHKRNYDKPARDKQVEAADAVYLYDSTVKTGQTSILESRWKPYYRIIEKTSPVNYRVKSQLTRRT